MAFGGRLWAWAVARSLKQWAMAAAGVVVLMSGLFGGLEKATPKVTELDQLKLGKTRHAHPLDLKVTGAYTTQRISNLHDEPRGRYLVVRATIRGTADESLYESTLGDTLRLAGVRGLYKTWSGDEISADARPSVFVAADRTQLTPAVPGLTYEVLFVWEQSAKVPAPRRITVVTQDLTHRKSTLDDQMLWTDAKPDARGRFTVATEAAT